MSLMSNRMVDRIQLLKPVQTPDDTTLGFTRSYETLLELWAEVNPISHGKYVRGVQIEMGMTHEVAIRRLSLESLSTEFSTAYSTAFRTKDIHPLKSEFFILVLDGNSGAGDLLRVRRTMEVGRRKEDLSFLCEEIEQRGTGWS